MAKLKIEFNNKAYLDYLFYDIGKQRRNFRVAIASLKDTETIFSKWKHYLDCQGDEKYIENVNQRTQLDNEINFEYDQKEGYKQLIKTLDKDGIKFTAYATEDMRAR